MHFRQRHGFIVLDGPKLYAALLAVKQVTGMTWDGLASQAGTTRISIGRLRRGRSVEATTYLRLVHWLDETNVTAFTKIEGEECTLRDSSPATAVGA